MAKTTSELNDILSLRYSVAKTNDRSLGRLAQFTEKLIDHLDIFPTTINLVAYRDGRAVGSLRATECRPGEPLQHVVFDYRESLANLRRSTFLLDMVVVVGEQETQAYLAKQLVQTALGLLARRGITRAFFSLPTALAMNFRGLSPIAAAFHSEALSLEIQPSVIDIESYYEEFLSGIADREILRFQDAFYMSLFAPGDILVAEGEKGTTAYLVSDGEVEVLVRNQVGELFPVNIITRGNLIGEVAMVTQEPRTASLIARTPVACISFDRVDFLKLMYAEPHRSLDLFRIFSKRLNESNKRMAEMKAGV